MSKNLVVSVLILVLLVGVGFFLLKDSKSTDIVEAPVVVNPEVPNQEEPIVKPIDNSAKLGTNVVLSLGASATFTDGLKVSLKQINDSRCKDGVVCVWQGELSSLINVSDGKIKTPAELVLGTENFKIQHMDGYTFTLKSATEKSITLSVIYEKPTFTAGGCFVGGCSGQICSDRQDVYTTCEWREEYACYKTARCERQKSGQCGWTPTSELNACLGN